MATSTTPGLTPSEAAFLAEHEMVDVIPRQRLDALQLLGGNTPALIPPRRTAVPLWLALLLRRQQRANIVSPAWLTVDTLTKILDLETSLGAERGFTRSPRHPTTASTEPAVSGPFIPGSSLSVVDTTQPSTSSRRARRARSEDLFVGDSDGEDNAASRPSRRDNANIDDDLDEEDDLGMSSDPLTSGQPGAVLPYHWLEVSHLLLGAAADDIPDSDGVRRLLRDLRETRAAKMRDGVIPQLDGGRAGRLVGIGALELAEHRGFMTGMMDGLRKIGASKEATRREREEEERERGGGRGYGRPGMEEDSDDDMGM